MLGNFLKLGQIFNLQHGKFLCKPAALKSFHASSCFKQQAGDQLEGSEESRRIYYGNLTPNFMAVKMFSLTTSITGLAALPILYDQIDTLGLGSPVIVAVGGFAGFFTFVTPFLLHTITKRYVTEIHYDSQSNEYFANILGFFLQKRQIKFKVEDVIVPEIPGMFTTFIVKSKASSRVSSLFVDPLLFDDPTHYVKIMGFDKPQNFKLDFKEEQKIK